MSDVERGLAPVAERIAADSAGTPHHDAVLRYVEAVLETQRRLLILERRIANTTLTFEGYRSQRRLDGLAREYTDLSRHVEQLSESMLTCRLGDVDGVDFDGSPEDDTLVEAIGAGPIPRHVGRLERTSTRVHQQLVAKQNAATTRTVAVVSVAAAVIALVSLFVAL